jgi:hypothetical protein
MKTIVIADHLRRRIHFREPLRSAATRGFAEAACAPSIWLTLAIVALREGKNEL